MCLLYCCNTVVMIKCNKKNMIYIYAFSRHFYPKRLTYSGYTSDFCLKSTITANVYHYWSIYKLIQEQQFLDSINTVIFLIPQKQPYFIPLNTLYDYRMLDHPITPHPLLFSALPSLLVPSSFPSLFLSWMNGRSSAAQWKLVS